VSEAERWDDEQVARASVEDAVAHPVVDSPPPRVAPLFAHLRLMKRQYWLLTGLDLVLAVVAFVLAGSGHGVTWLYWALGALWVVLAGYYLCYGAALARRERPIILE
jgi:hypothetical protein